MKEKTTPGNRSNTMGRLGINLTLDCEEPNSRAESRPSFRATGMADEWPADADAFLNDMGEEMPPTEEELDAEYRRQALELWERHDLSACAAHVLEMDARQRAAFDAEFQARFPRCINYLRMAIWGARCRASRAS
jgi:hypothetical protein